MSLPEGAWRGAIYRMDVQVGCRAPSRAFQMDTLVVGEESDPAVGCLKSIVWGGKKTNQRRDNHTQATKGVSEKAYGGIACGIDKDVAVENETPIKHKYISGQQAQFEFPSNHAK